MSWKTKVQYEDMILYCEIYRNRGEIRKHFELTNTESIHCCNWFSKFDDDFIVTKDVGNTGKATWLKSTKEALQDVKKRPTI